jgi:hypothetical protein
VAQESDMHYANGRAAIAGDVVRGKGYNIKHEIVGLLVYANPGASACNCQVATVSRNLNVKGAILETGETTLQPSYPGSLGQIALTGFMQIEYGQLDAFVALDPATGEVLPGPFDASPEPKAEWSDSDGADLAGAIVKANREFRSGTT